MSHQQDKEKINPYTGREYSEKYYQLLEKQKNLPIVSFKQQFIDAVDKHQVLILVGDGAGKTTQVPQFIVEGKFIKEGKQCIITQPRRNAAIMVAQRVAEEMDIVLGEEIGYNTRYEEYTSGRTFMKHATDGVLIREIMKDPLLEKYSVVVVDEAQERTTNTDLLLGLLKEIIKKRQDLKLIVISTTAQNFETYFDNSPVFVIPNVRHPIEIFYTKEIEKDYVEAAITTVIQIHVNEQPGDILLFLASKEDIESACKKIVEKTSNLLGAEGTQLSCLSLYSSLPVAQQLKIYEPSVPSIRRVIVSSSIAEASISIDGIRYVIDSGFSEKAIYNPNTSVEYSVVSPISQASALLRATKAGRSYPGRCFRLYTNASLSDLPADNLPEILSTNLGSVVLSLKKFGINDLSHFSFIDSPSPASISRSVEALTFLGALDNDGNFTEVGNQMAEFPLDPKLAKMLICSPNYHCSNEILSIVSLLSVSNIFLGSRETRAQFFHPDGDHLTLLNVFLAFKSHEEDPKWCYDNFLDIRTLKLADNIRQQISKIMQRLNLPLGNFPEVSSEELSENIRKCLVSGFFMQVAHLEQSGHYLTVKDNQVVELYPSTGMDKRPEWVVYNEFVVTSKTYIKTVSEIKGEWLLEISKDYFELTTFPSCEAKIALDSLAKLKL